MTELHPTEEMLRAGLDDLRLAPRDGGEIRLIVRRPAENEREVLEVADLTPDEGLAGDHWRFRPSSRTPDRSPHPDCQLTLMGSRVAALVAGDPERWALAGDQIYLDLDLSSEILPPGTLLRLGTAIVEITDQPHTGCRKFVERFGLPAMRFVSSPEGRRLNLRGVYARVVQAGRVATGDRVARVERPDLPGRS